MVYTVTFNPSLDYVVTVDDFRLGLTNRTTSEELYPGGKGINVSVMLRNLGIENAAIYYAAGFVGDEITRKIVETGIRAEEIRIPEGCSRINLKLKSIDGTEINGMGPAIRREHVDALYEKLDRISSGDTLVLAGSIPGSLPDSMYSDIMARLEGRGVRICVDATRDLLVNVLKYKPFLVKPNNHELGEIFGAELATRESVVPYARKLQEMGAENVIISMAGEGAVFVASDGRTSLREAPKGTLVNGVGAGDSMVAGFVAGYLKTGDLMEAFYRGIAAGSATAFADYLATGDEVEAVYRQVTG